MTLIKGSKANSAANAVLRWVTHQRLNDPNYLSRIVFSYPRIKQEGISKWTDGSALLAAATSIARNPESRREHIREPKTYDYEHSIPSIVVWLHGIVDIEYHVSRKNMERLLAVGCIVFQRNKRGFFVRIPFGSPLYHGQPH